MEQMIGLFPVKKMSTLPESERKGWFAKLYDTVVHYVNEYLSDEVKTWLYNVAVDRFKAALIFVINRYFPRANFLVNYIEQYMNGQYMDMWYDIYRDMIDRPSE